jgi:hypothetical protein
MAEPVGWVNEVVTDVVAGAAWLTSKRRWFAMRLFLM